MNNKNTVIEWQSNRSFTNLYSRLWDATLELFYHRLFIGYSMTLI